MAKQTFKGRPLLPGDLEGEALVSHQPFNTTGSYFDNMFAGVTDWAHPNRVPEAVVVAVR